MCTNISMMVCSDVCWQKGEGLYQYFMVIYSDVCWQKGEGLYQYFMVIYSNVCWQKGEGFVPVFHGDIQRCLLAERRGVCTSISWSCPYGGVWNAIIWDVYHATDANRTHTQQCL